MIPITNFLKNKWPAILFIGIALSYVLWGVHIVHDHWNYVKETMNKP